VEDPSFTIITGLGALSPPEYDIEGVWAKGASGIVAGRPRSAKSRVAVELAVWLAAGTAFLGVEQFKARSGASVTLIHAETRRRDGTRSVAIRPQTRLPPSVRSGITPVTRESRGDETRQPARSPEMRSACDRLLRRQVKDRSGFRTVWRRTCCFVGRAGTANSACFRAFRDYPRWT
jgi:RecA-family ATPase